MIALSAARIFGWLAGAMLLIGAVLFLDVLSPDFSMTTFVMLLVMATALLIVRFTAKRTSDIVSHFVALIISVWLAAIAVSVVGEDPSVWSPSPWWYRAGQVAVLLAPLLFWILFPLRLRRSLRKPTSIPKENQMSEIRMSCPQCKRLIFAPKESAGRSVGCPSCGNLFQAPFLAAYIRIASNPPEDARPSEAVSEQTDLEHINPYSTENDTVSGGIKQKKKSGAAAVYKMIEQAVCYTKAKWDAAGGTELIKKRVSTYSDAVKQGFVPDAGTTGVRAITSRIRNLWSRGGIGKVTIISACVILYLLVPNDLFGASDRKRAATVRAWNDLQTVDNTLRQYRDWSVERQQQQAYLYSQINLTDVDPILQRHLRESIAVCKRSVRVLSTLEAEYRKIQGGVETAAGFGALLGAAGSDGYNPQGDAAAGGLFLGLLGAAIGEGAWQDVLNAHRPEIKKMEQEYQKICEQDGEVSEKLSRKYGVVFSDPF